MPENITLNRYTYPLVEGYLCKAIEEDPFEQHPQPRRMLVAIRMSCLYTGNCTVTARVLSEDLLYFIQFLIQDLALQKDEYLEDIRMKSPTNFDDIISKLQNAKR